MVSKVIEISQKGKVERIMENASFELGVEWKRGVIDGESGDERDDDWEKGGPTSDFIYSYYIMYQFNDNTRKHMAYWPTASADDVPLTDVVGLCGIQQEVKAIAVFDFRRTIGCVTEIPAFVTCYVVTLTFDC